MRLNGDSIGALNIYSRRPRAWPASLRSVADAVVNGGLRP